MQQKNFAKCYKTKQKVSLFIRFVFRFFLPPSYLLRVGLVASVDRPGLQVHGRASVGLAVDTDRREAGGDLRPGRHGRLCRGALCVVVARATASISGG